MLLSIRESSVDLSSTVTMATVPSWWIGTGEHSEIVEFSFNTVIRDTERNNFNFIINDRIVNSVLSSNSICCHSTIPVLFSIDNLNVFQCYTTVYGHISSLLICWHFAGIVFAIFRFIKSYFLFVVLMLVVVVQLSGRIIVGSGNKSIIIKSKHNQVPSNQWYALYGWWSIATVFCANIASGNVLLRIKPGQCGNCGNCTFKISVTYSGGCGVGGGGGGGGCK